MREWFNAHREHPYLSEQDKGRLRHDTGLSATQISNWFTNARRRNRSNSSCTSSASDANDWKDMSALDRWRHSPPELEPASLTAIAEAVGQADSERRHIAPHDHNSRDTSSSSATFDTISNWTGSSGGSSDSLGSRAKRRRRRRFHNVARHMPADDRKYQCTFCTDRFKTKYDWTRHEATQHLSLEQWSCAPFGPTALVPGRSTPLCTFCGADDPSATHIEIHRYAECAEKPASSRTFYRKDHLKQHLQQFHGVQDFTSFMTDWGTRISRIHSRCGFCKETFDDWSARNAHLADHFRNGAEMKDWEGCRGLEPSVARIVQNAIPPYLIGNEAAALNPFSAEPRSALKDARPSYKDPNASTDMLRPTPTSFEVLVAKLSGFVNEQKAQNCIPTDQMLQEKARLIVYGDEDPWNQTAADNHQWLELFKMGHGIDAASRAADTQDAAAVTVMCPSALADDAAFRLPWYWQSPECLVEFRQCKASFVETPFDCGNAGIQPSTTNCGSTLSAPPRMLEHSASTNNETNCSAESNTIELDNDFFNLAIDASLYETRAYSEIESVE